MSTNPAGQYRFAAPIFWPPFASSENVAVTVTVSPAAMLLGDMFSVKGLLAALAGEAAAMQVSATRTAVHVPRLAIQSISNSPIRM